MEKEHTVGQVVRSTWDLLLTTKVKVQEFILILMAQVTMANGKKTKNTEKVFIRGPKATVLLENTLMDKVKDKVCIDGLMEAHTKGSGKVVSHLDQELILLQMEIRKKSHGKMDK